MTPEVRPTTLVSIRESIACRERKPALSAPVLTTQRSARSPIHGFIVARRLLGFFAAAPPRAFADLSEREHEILRFMAQGRSNYEIADALTVCAKTVQNHVSNIFGKLQVADRTQAVVRAREAGLRVDQATVGQGPAQRSWRATDSNLSTILTPTGTSEY
jgi:DNA-binding NarL/FixJ family response regulator